MLERQSLDKRDFFDHCVSEQDEKVNRSQGSPCLEQALSAWWTQVPINTQTGQVEAALQGWFRGRGKPVEPLPEISESVEGVFRKAALYCAQAG
jgi:hypothetical protein